MIQERKEEQRIKDDHDDWSSNDESDDDDDLDEADLGRESDAENIIQEQQESASSQSINLESDRRSERRVVEPDDLENSYGLSIVIENNSSSNQISSQADSSGEADQLVLQQLPRRQLPNQEERKSDFNNDCQNQQVIAPCGAQGQISGPQFTKKLNKTGKNISKTYKQVVKPVMDPIINQIRQKQYCNSIHGNNHGIFVKDFVSSGSVNFRRSLSDRNLGQRSEGFLDDKNDLLLKCEYQSEESCMCKQSILVVDDNAFNLEI